jgi:hypothetical protein
MAIGFKVFVMRASFDGMHVYQAMLSEYSLVSAEKIKKNLIIII